MDSQENCAHKTFTNTKKLPKCPYSDPFKCKYYNLWIDKTKLLRNDDTAHNSRIKRWVELYKQKWIKE